MRRKIPNILSLSRVLIAPIFYFLFVSSNPEYIFWSLVLFTIGAITDYFDGWLARRMKATSAWGKFFDPLADKFLTSAAFVAFAAIEIIPWWMVIVIVIRDFGTTFLRMFNPLERELVTSKTAKWKTVLQMVFIFMVLLIYTLSTNFSGIMGNIEWVIFSPYSYFAMLLITLLTVWTLIEYLYLMFKKED